MPLTQLDAESALVLIDLQKGVVGMAPAHVADEVVTRAAQLAEAFRKRGLPVVLVNVDQPAPKRTDAGRQSYSLPPDWAELVPELNQQSDDILITKRTWGAFLGTDLDQKLRERGVTQIVLAGIATSIGVESTARSAYDLGYNLVLVVDAMADRSVEAHEHTASKIFPRLGEVEITANVLNKLQN